MSLLSFYVVLPRVITLSYRALFTVFYRDFSHALVIRLLSYLFSRFNEAKFRLLQSGKLHQEVDREVSRLRPQNTRVPVHPYEKDE